jgi:hypothetical protein
VSTSTASAPSVRCPACSAYVRAGSQWCTLCYADLRPKPDQAPGSPTGPTPAETPPAAALVAGQDGEPLAPVPPAAPAPKRGKHAKQVADSPVFGQPTQVVAEAEIEAIADQMLAQLAVERENPLGSLSGIVDSKGKQVALMVGGAVVAMCLLFLLMALAGSFV